MKVLKALLPVCFVMLLLFLGYSMAIAPFSVMHGYYVGAAKLMAQGLTPFKDFNLMDLPLGVWILSIPYYIIGNKVSGILAVSLIGLAHLLNFYLVFRLLRRVGVRSSYRWVTLLFYFIILYSTDALFVNVEFFAVTFLLLALLYGEGRSTLKQGVSALCFVLAVCCKVQILVMLPAVLLTVFFPLHGNKYHSRRVLRFSGFTLLFGLSTYLLLAVSTGEMQLWSHIDWHFFFSGDYYLSMTVAEVCILLGRTSLYLILPGLFGLFVKQDNTRRFALILLVALLGQLVLVFAESTKASTTFMYPFVALCFACTLQDMAGRKRWLAVVFFLSTFIMPAYLLVREFTKLEMGDVKEEQQAYLDVLKEMYPEKTEAVLLTYRCFEADLSAQIYSEIPTLVPFDMKHTKWGLNHWEDVPEGSYVKRAITSAPLVITNEQFLLWYDTMNIFTHETWYKEFSDYLLHNQDRMFGLGDFQIITKD